MQYRLERMVNELEDLERRGLFSRREIAEIVKKRRKFEYRLKRPSPLKQDFLAYIEYEKQLDSLRVLRKKATSRELKKKGNKKLKKSVSDFAGISRILGIYRLATMRFKGDIGLWFQYLEFCRQKRNGRMKKVLADVIRFHPKVPGVWIYAAAWEFDHNLNVMGARALMQSGLRECPTSEDLWVEYLRMELTYLNKLKARKIALGEVETTVKPEDKQWREENKELFMSLNQEINNNNMSKSENGESEKKQDVLLEQGLNILQTVYNGAVEALPSCFGLRKRLYEILEAIDIRQAESVREDMLTDMKRDFSSQPDYWDWLARLEINGIISKKEMGYEDRFCELRNAIQVYEEAIKISPSATLFNLYTKFLMAFIAPKTEDSHISGIVINSGHTSNLISLLLKVYKKAETTGCMTEDLAYQYISLHLQMGRLDEAKNLAEMLCKGEPSHAVSLWVLRVSIEMKCATLKSSSPSKDDLHSIFELMRSVLTKVSVSDTASLWLMALKFYANHQQYLDKLVELSLISLIKYGGSENGFSLSFTIVILVLQKEGFKGAREMYKRFLALPRPGLALYKKCIELEMNLASLGEKDCLANARKLYESALTTYDQDTSLWRDYYSMEIKVGTSETASAVYWRARKTLKDTAELITFTYS